MPTIRVSDRDLPEPGAPPEPLEADLAALLARHIKRSTKINPDTGRAPARPSMYTEGAEYRRYCWEKGFDDICITPEGFKEN